MRRKIAGLAVALTALLLVAATGWGWVSSYIYADLWDKDGDALAVVRDLDSLDGFDDFDLVAATSNGDQLYVVYTGTDLEYYPRGPEEPSAMVDALAFRLKARSASFDLTVQNSTSADITFSMADRDWAGTDSRYDGCSINAPETTVPAGQAVVIPVSVTAPARAGTYMLDPWQLMPPCSVSGIRGLLSAAKPQGRMIGNLEVVIDGVAHDINAAIAKVDSLDRILVSGNGMDPSLFPMEMEPYLARASMLLPAHEILVDKPEVTLDLGTVYGDSQGSKVYVYFRNMGPCNYFLDTDYVTMQTFLTPFNALNNYWVEHLTSGLGTLVSFPMTAEGATIEIYPGNIPAPQGTRSVKTSEPPFSRVHVTWKHEPANGLLPFVLDDDRAFIGMEFATQVDPAVASDEAMSGLNPVAVDYNAINPASVDVALSSDVTESGVPAITDVRFDVPYDDGDLPPGSTGTLTFGCRLMALMSQIDALPGAEGSAAETIKGLMDQNKTLAEAVYESHLISVSKIFDGETGPTDLFYTAAPDFETFEKLFSFALSDAQDPALSVAFRVMVVDGPSADGTRVKVIEDSDGNGVLVFFDGLKDGVFHDPLVMGAVTAEEPEPESGSGGGCNAAGLGALALLGLVPLSLFLKRR
jgi:Synergist-CTERM protein sorting domain-containing protein